MSVPFVNEPKKENPYLSFIEPAVETTKALLQPWGPVEAGLNLATQTYGLPAAGLAGIAGLPFGKSEQWSLDVGKALIYEPQTAAGRKVLEATSVPFEMLGKASERVADVTRESTGRPSPSVFPWMAEAFPYGEQEPTPEERVTAGTVAGTAVMGLPLLLGARKGLTKPKVEYPTTPMGIATGMKVEAPNPYLDLISSERGSLGPTEQAKVASLRRQVESISKKKESSVPQIEGLKYEGIQDLSSINKPNQFVFTDSETGSTFSTTDLSKANLEANRDRIRAKFAEYRTPKYSIGDPVKTKDFEGVVAEINPDGSLLVGNKSGAMKEVRPTDILKGQRGSLGEPGKPKGWTSTLQSTIESKMPNQAPVEQVRGLIKGAGVKEDEIKWSGLDEYLQGKEKISKPELMNYLKENQVEVKEIVKGQIPSDARPTELSKFVTKFSQWQLPGGENYRELLMTIPEKPSRAEVAVQSYQSKMNKKYGRSWSPADLTPEENAEGNSLFANKERYPAPTPFTGSHWDESNVLAHIRFNDRTVEGKKVLFIEEVQSDWHQAGREKGYKSAELEKEAGILSKQLGEEARQYMKTKGGGITTATEELTRKNPDFAARVAKYNELQRSAKEGVPQAPFSKTWHEMAIRRMVRWASENGYDRIAWTTGEQQAARYDLSKQVSRVIYQPDNKLLIAHGLSGDEVIRQSGISPEKLPDYIGKEAASKILQQQVTGGGTKGAREQVLSGLDLKVGGEGMKGFYDKILPEYMNKFGKKWGAKVGESEIKTPTTVSTVRRPETGMIATPEDQLTKVHSFDITPSMKESVDKQGLPLFQLAPFVAGGAGLATERALRKDKK